MKLITHTIQENWYSFIVEEALGDLAGKWVYA